MSFKEEDTEEDSAALLRFQSSISQFALGSPEKEQLRRSPRKPRPVARLTCDSSDSPSRKETKPYTLGEKSPKKQKRAYAAPEVYAHLRELNDHLAVDLDVIFCGINPGKKSAETGHHFGHPSNHFYWCLHQSGFTDTKLSPTEDFTLPDQFSLGLTNLVHRPTSEQMELSREEQIAGVPVFLGKIARYRPQIVCFVGLNIAQVVESSLKANLKHAKTWGLRQYKMIHPSPSKYSETLFFAAPSTSGLVTQFQRPAKAKIFGELRQIVERLKTGEMITEGMFIIRADQIAPTPSIQILETLKAEADSETLF